MKAKIINAIRARECLSFTYSGLKRKVQPAAVGVSPAGKEVLRCYQTEGGHVLPGHAWDLCCLSNISNLVGTGELFSEAPPGYRRGDKGMSVIFAEL